VADPVSRQSVAVQGYILREQLDRLWTYKIRTGVLTFLNGWCHALPLIRWERLPEKQRLGTFLFKGLEGIAAYCDHHVRIGVVESINTTIKRVRVLRRARGMRERDAGAEAQKGRSTDPIGA